MRFLLIKGKKSKKKAAQLLIHAAKKHFDSVLSIPLNGIKIECIGGKTKLFYKNTDLTKFDACYARVFGDEFVFADLVLDILESNGVYLPASAEAFQIANHKYYTIKVLSKVNVPVPASALCVGQQAAVRITKKLGFPVVVKLLSGFGGKGIMLVQNEAEFKPLMDTLNVFNEFISLQEFIKTKGDDIRCYVVGDEVYAVKRSAQKGEWRSNVSRGGEATPTKLSLKHKKIVLNAAKILGLELGAVDLLKSEGQFLVIEVNYTPGMLIKFFGRKYAEIFMEFTARRTKEKKLIV